MSPICCRAGRCWLWRAGRRRRLGEGNLADVAIDSTGASSGHLMSANQRRQDDKHKYKSHLLSLPVSVVVVVVDFKALQFTWAPKTSQ